MSAAAEAIFIALLGIRGLFIFGVAGHRNCWRRRISVRTRREVGRLGQPRTESSLSAELGKGKVNSGVEQ